jgi:hypothetical protein
MPIRKIIRSDIDALHEAVEQRAKPPRRWRPGVVLPGGKWDASHESRQIQTALPGRTALPVAPSKTRLDLTWTCRGAKPATPARRGIETAAGPTAKSFAFRQQHFGTFAMTGSH